MSATPIPRTLQMSLAGVRDISVIETPPEGRRPVKTYVGEYDEELVRRALRAREGARRPGVLPPQPGRDDRGDGRAAARRCARACASRSPTARWTSGKLEQRMLAFLRGDADVLVCTSIIESGIDIPQANTLIVERADIFGLAQLYQIRGRVGRSRERAYAYLLYPSAAALTPEAAQRLSRAVATTPSSAPGFKIAMRDLEIRGAGNLLGDEQSGHVAALGFELYMQMLDEAVAAASRTAPRPDEDWEPVRLDVNVDAYVPADYIPYEQAKVDVHRRIAGVARGGRSGGAARGARGPLRRAARAAAEPDRAAAGADQARPGRGAGGDVPRRPAGGDPDRARLGPRQADPGRDPRGAVRVGQVAAVGAGARGSRPSASRRSCGPPMCCWR